MAQPTTLQSFIRSQLGSLIATIADFTIFFIGKELLGVFYGLASYAGNITGAIVSFILGRNWAFKSTDGKITNQAVKYIITSVISSFLNTGMLIFIVEKTSMDPYIIKISVSLLVGILFNFFMYKYFVFK